MVASLFTAAADALAGAVVELRKRKGLTQRDLAKAIGREHSYVGRVETKQRRLDIVEWIAICQACDVDPIVETRRLLQRIVPLMPRRQSHIKPRS